MRLIRSTESDDFELFLSRRARDYYDIDSMLRTQPRTVSDFQLARRIAGRINDRRGAARNPAAAVEPGWIHAAWTFADIVIALIESDSMAGRATGLLEHVLAERLGADDTRDLLDRFAREYPPARLYRGEITVPAYLEGTTRGQPNRTLLLQNLLVVWLLSQNRAFARLADLFDISGFVSPALYLRFDESLRAGLSSVMLPDRLLDLLLTPSRLFPDSIEQQLEYMRANWRGIARIPDQHILAALDMMREEHKPVFGPGPGPVEAPGLGGLESEPERFSPDLDWMPRLVLLAKNTHVWLYQLTRIHNRPIRTLDAIPDEELQAIARRGVSGLWLIGVWERSDASRRIKRMCGNPEADASAYSIIDYTIATDLGGEPAFEVLREKAWKHGIRLAGDMVPNHMGIDSNWVIRNPHRFVSRPDCPFPSYSFTGPDLSPDPDTVIQIDDHYFDRTDAAVVFRREDRRTGSVRYVYHGNDGTVMPWNDTAQLDYLNPETREAVIRAILDVARRFPIIRFDAAMTLAKRHYQRLWHPEPGTGGSIASRAEFSMTKEAFNEAMPEEFWREVVERIAAEAPDTLLLAEAFWLMEGYFVRTLGMHRVYNSAFMNMLRDELNGQYRSVIRNTLEFDSDVLKRYVNFMNNPDEKTAVEQFGRFSKYFGACVMLATLPGLPMFGHGQFEGFTEKYGMEYRRSYRNEQPDIRFMRYHDRIISPLLHRRRLFADAEDFRLYDFVTPSGAVDENVFAYSNRHGTASTLIVFNNHNGRTRGLIRTSTPVRDKRSAVETPAYIRTGIHEALGLRGGEGVFCIWREQVSGLQYIRRSDAIIQEGLQFELGPYEHRAYLDITEVSDSADGFYAHIAEYLKGRGAWDIAETSREIEYGDILRPFRDLLSSLFTPHESARRRKQVPRSRRGFVSTHLKLLPFFRAVRRTPRSRGPVRLAVYSVQSRFKSPLFMRAIPPGESPVSRFDARNRRKLAQFILSDAFRLRWMRMSAVLGGLGKLAPRTDRVGIVREWIDEWLLGRLIMRRAMERDIDEDAARRGAAILRALTVFQMMRADQGSFTRVSQAVRALIATDSEFRWLIGANEFDQVVWFRKESWEELLAWMSLERMSRMPSRCRGMKSGRAIIRYWAVLGRLEAMARRSGYRLESLRGLLRDQWKSAK